MLLFKLRIIKYVVAVCITFKCCYVVDKKSVDSVVVVGITVVISVAASVVDRL